MADQAADEAFDLQEAMLSMKKYNVDPRSLNQKQMRDMNRRVVQWGLDSIPEWEHRSSESESEDDDGGKDLLTIGHKRNLRQATYPEKKLHSIISGVELTPESSKSSAATGHAISATALNAADAAADVSTSSAFPLADSNSTGSISSPTKSQSAAACGSAGAISRCLKSAAAAGASHNNMSK